MGFTQPVTPKSNPQLQAGCPSGTSSCLCSDIYTTIYHTVPSTCKWLVSLETGRLTCTPQVYKTTCIVNACTCTCTCMWQHSVSLCCPKILFIISQGITRYSTILVPKATSIPTSHPQTDSYNMPMHGHVVLHTHTHTQATVDDTHTHTHTHSHTHKWICTHHVGLCKLFTCKLQVQDYIWYPPTLSHALSLSLSSSSSPSLSPSLSQVNSDDHACHFTQHIKQTVVT